jgi:hypothetical protein
MRNIKHSRNPQQRLLFATEEVVWKAIPEDAREQCRTLVMQLLVEALRRNERQGEGREREN